MKHYRFYIGCFALCYILAGFFDLGHYFLGEPTDLEKANWFRYSGIVTFLFGLTMGWNVLTFPGRRSPEAVEQYRPPYPRTEAVLYSLAGLIALAGAFFLTSSGWRIFDQLDAWGRAENIAFLILAGVMAAGAFRDSWRAWRKAKLPTREELFKIP